MKDNKAYKTHIHIKTMPKESIDLESIDLLCEYEDEELSAESSNNLGVPLYTNVTEYIMHDAYLEQAEYRP